MEIYNNTLVKITRTDIKKNYFKVPDYIKKIDCQQFPEELFFLDLNNVTDASIYNSTKIKSIVGDNVLKFSLYDNKGLESFSFPNAKEIYSFGFRCNDMIKSIYLQNVITIGDSCICHNDNLEVVYMPKLKNSGDGCFKYNDKLLVLNINNENIDFKNKNETLFILKGYSGNSSETVYKVREFSKIRNKKIVEHNHSGNLPFTIQKNRHFSEKYEYFQ